MTDGHGDGRYEATRTSVECPLRARVVRLVNQPAQVGAQSLEATLYRRVATEQGLALAEGKSGSNVLVFKKGMTLVSWGSKFRVEFDVVTPTATRLTVHTDETFAITDWGQGKRASHKLLDALGAYAKE